MRLIQIDDPLEKTLSWEKTLSLVERVGNEIPSYLILSHTWGDDKDEVTFKDMRKGRGRDKYGYDKIRFCLKQALDHGLRYFWVDTCCIDKSSSAELSEAINSMHRWYQNAAVCVVLLSDVSVHEYIPRQIYYESAWEYDSDLEGTFEDEYEKNETKKIHEARWFTRGWTLQELLAPKVIKFFSEEWELLGDRDELVDSIHQATRIDKRALQGADLSGFSVEERLSWAEGRSTKREEDMAYSLLGLFDVHMPLLYGEGKKKALHRLKKEVSESMRDAPPQLSSTSMASKQEDLHEPKEKVIHELQAIKRPRKQIDAESMLRNPFFPHLNLPTPTPTQQDDSFTTQALNLYIDTRRPASDPITERQTNLAWRMMAMSLLPRTGEANTEEH
jgi:hypothetical protein